MTRPSLSDVRRYLRGVEALAREARTSTDLRVVVAALEILGHQYATIVELPAREGITQWQ